MSAKKEAVERLAQGVARVADDWGWRGGKPGEMTGIGIQDAFVSGSDRIALKQARKQLERHALERPNSEIAKNWSTLNDMFSYTDYIDEPTANLMGDFRRLEQAGVPREWTGRVLESLYRFGSGRVNSPGLNLRRIGDTRVVGDAFGPVGFSGIAKVADVVSDLMRPMSNAERDVFLTMLPRWSGTIDDLASTARRMARAERMGR
jgi:hypothetical protein